VCVTLLMFAPLFDTLMMIVMRLMSTYDAAERWSPLRHVDGYVIPTLERRAIHTILFTSYAMLPVDPDDRCAQINARIIDGLMIYSSRCLRYATLMMTRRCYH